MTYEQIEKEFDEKFCSFNLSADERCKECLHKTFDGSSVADGCGSADEYIKSFLKQSFIKYLEGEVERLENTKKDITEANDYAGDPSKWRISIVSYNLAVQHQITHLQAQITKLQ